MRTPTDDATLARKVESELARLDRVPREKISVNSAEGVVQLRGEADSQELIDTLAERARTVEGVRDVENLLHLPGAEAPMHQ
jgi:osmotically-inducible protein OsmY